MNIKTIDSQTKSVQDEKGNSYEYDKLLIATGGEANKLPYGDNNILYYRKLNDYKSLRNKANVKNNFVIIGGGFIGTEIAAGLAMNGKNVTMIFPDKYIGEKVYPSNLASFITVYYKEKGVNILHGDYVLMFEKKNEVIHITTSSGKDVYADYAVAGIGIKPNVSLAQSIGAHVDNGIHVNAFLKSNIEEIYSAGDVANFYNPILNKRIRIEHADNANKMGKAAGLSMAGKGEPYNYLPFFYSDLFELGYEAIGELNSSYQIYSDWKNPYRKGVIYYINEGKVRGVLLWDVWGKINDARELIAAKEKIVNPEDLKDRIGF